MGETLLMLEYSNVFVGLLALTTQTSIYKWTFCWETVAVAGLLAALLLFLFTLETKLVHIKINNSDGLKFRKNAAPGCWCCLLLPFVSLACWAQTKATPSEGNWQMMLVSLGLLGATLLWMQALVWKLTSSPAKASLGKQTFWQVMAVALVVGLAMVHLWQIGIITALVTSLVCHGLFCIFVFVLPKAFPHSFTVGEMILWSQGGALFIVTAIGNLGLVIRGAETVSQSTATTLVAEVILLTCLLVFGVLAIPVLRGPLAFYGLWIAAAVFLVIPLTTSLLNENFVVWLIKFLLATKVRIYLLLSWVMLIVVAAMVVVYQQYTESQASTVTRKLFHGLLLFVYVPGLIWDPELLKLASLITFAVFLILECIRVLHIPPLGPLLKNALNIFLDEKDSGPLILTPIYLLIGCSMPIWLDPNRTSAVVSLASWSGLLSLGIGDTVASVMGMTLGSHRWPQSKKTLEGTGLSVLAQLLAVTVLTTSDWWPLQLPSLRISLVIVTSSLMEAFTSQVDNLVVPLWTFLMFLSV